jgi:hypothetical protein
MGGKMSRPTLSKGDIVVMDNLSSHKGPRVAFSIGFMSEQLVKAAGAELLRKIAERTVAGLLIALDACADIFKPPECVNYFRACGYDTC